MCAIYYIKCTERGNLILSSDGVEYNQCNAMNKIGTSVYEASGNTTTCVTMESCLTTTCTLPDGQQLQLNLLKCEHPVGFQLVNLDTNGDILFSHNFTHSENISATIDHLPVILNVTLVHLRFMIELPPPYLPLGPGNRRDCKRGQGIRLAVNY